MQIKAVATKEGFKQIGSYPYSDDHAPMQFLPPDLMPKLEPECFKCERGTGEHSCWRREIQQNKDVFK